MQYFFMKNSKNFSNGVSLNSDINIFMTSYCHFQVSELLITLSTCLLVLMSDLSKSSLKQLLPSLLTGVVLLAELHVVSSYC